MMEMRKQTKQHNEDLPRPPAFVVDVADTNARFRIGLPFLDLINSTSPSTTDPYSPWKGTLPTLRNGLDHRHLQRLL